MHEINLSPFKQSADFTIGNLELLTELKTLILTNINIMHTVLDLMHAVFCYLMVVGLEKKNIWC